MADSVRVTNLPESGNPQRVALDLAVKIHATEHPYGGAQPAAPRAYWLDLYAECLYAASGYRDRAK